MKTVLIVDDHPVARLAVRILLEKDDMTVVGETADGHEAIQLAKTLSPDLIMIDIDIPSLNGIDVMQRLRKNNYTGGLLVLSAKDDDHYIRRCASVGASGFISKRNNLTELHVAIHAIRNGYGYFPLNLNKMDSSPSNHLNDKQKIAELSTKELQVLHLLAKGMKSINIAQQMRISDKTVSTYKRRLMLKLDLHNIAELYDFIQRNNLD
ncbi:response regulator [Providencia rettgeri]